MATNPDFRDLFSEFNAHDVRYLVVGGYAFSFYAKPRYTKDLDIWVEVSKENAPRVLAALRAFGAPAQELSLADLERAGVVFQIGQPPNRVDILTRIEGVEFADAWPRRAEGHYADQRIWLVSRADLVLNKRLLGRTQDLADIETLEAFERGV